MLIDCINLEYYPLLSALPSFTSLRSVTVGSEGLGEASSLPFRGGSGWGFKVGLLHHVLWFPCYKLLNILNADSH